MRLNWIRVFAALVLALGLAACEAPRQPTLAPTSVLEVSRLVEQQFRSQIGKTQGDALKFKYTRVSRQDTHITLGLLFENDVLIQLARTDPDRFAAAFQDGFERSFCAAPETRLMVNSGMTITNDFLDRSGNTIFSRTLNKC